MRRVRAAFTLVEVLMGLALLMGTFYSVVAMVPTSLSSLRKSQHVVTATNLARQSLETWQHAPFRTLVATPGPQTSTTDLDGESYTVVVCISDPDIPDPNLKRIDVVVTQAGSSTELARETTCVFNYTNPW